MFRAKSDAIQIGTDQIKIACRNGLQFRPDEEIVWDVPRNVGFADLSNAYVEVDIRIENPTNSDAQEAAAPCLMFDRVTGASSCVNQVSIRSDGRLLEQLYPYNCYAQIHYGATSDEGMVNKRTRLEGCAKSYRILDNPFVVPNRAIVADLNPIAGGVFLNNAPACWTYVTRKVCLPLLGGVFTNPRSHPCMAVPLTVHLLLEKALRCLRVVHCGGTQGPVQNTTTAALSQTGEDVTPMDDTTGAADLLTCASVSAWNSIGGATAGGNVLVLAEGENAVNQLVNFPYRVGQTVRIDAWVGGAAVNSLGVIESMGMFDHTAAAALRNHVVVKFVANVVAGVATRVTMRPILNTGQALPAAGTISYTWTNPRLVIPKVVPPPAVVQNISRAIAKGQYNMDVVSWSSYQNAIPANQTTSTNIIPADLSRCKAILSVPVSQTKVDDLQTSNALCGQYLNAESYQYSVNNRLLPDRVVNLTRERFPALYQHTFHEWQAPYQLGQYNEGAHIHETEKALVNANMNPRNLSSVTLNNANDQTLQNANRSGSWLVARSLGAGVGTSENLIGKSCILYLNYQSAVPSTMVKLLHNYVVHIRTLSVGMNGVEVFY
jgi:hypothetical protein